MKFSAIAFAAVIAGLAASPAMAFEAYQKPALVQPQLPALALQAIKAATPAMQKLKPDWQTYKVQAAETANALIVSFWQTPAGKSAAAQAGHTDFVVIELDKQTLKVTSVHQFSV